MIVAVRKTALAAHLKIDLTILLPLFGNDVDKPAGTAPAVQRGRSGDHFDMFDVEWIDASSWRLSVREELSRTPSISTTIARPRMFIP